METLEEKIARVVAEHVAIVPYDPAWPGSFERERDHLRSCLPDDLIGRIEHFGSTAVPGLAAKPIVDLLVEVTDLEQTKTRIAPLLEAQGYDYFWRATSGDDTPPFYAWFIKRDARGERTHHIHMVEAQFEHWDGLLFRDYLIAHPAVAREYAELKIRLAERHGRDRVAYTNAKSDFIVAITAQARVHFRDRPARMRRLLLVRHCESSGQAPDAPLTARGYEQAETLADFLATHPIDRVVSSPYRRARETIAPFAARAGLIIETHDGLMERRLSPTPIDAWRDVVRRSFSEPEYAIPGGESGREVLARGWAAIESIAASGCRCPVVVSHGQLLSLVLHSFDPSFGYAGWESLSNPDVHLLEADEGGRTFRWRRVWA